MVVFEAKKRGNVKRRAEYRRVRVYYKSLGQRKREELRRQRVLELSSQGLSLAQIALQVGVSPRTVQRDLGRSRASVECAFKREVRSLAEEDRARVLDQLEGLNPQQQFTKIRNLLSEKQHSATRRLVCHKLRVTFDVDAALAGRPALSFRPMPPVALVAPGVINFRQIVNGESRYIGQLTVN